MTSSEKNISFPFKVYFEGRQPLKGTISNIIPKEVRLYSDAGPKALKLSSVPESAKAEFEYEDGEVMEA